MNEVQYPARPYQPDFSSGNYSREYAGLFKALNQNTTDVFCSITKEQFGAGRTIFGFNFATDSSDGCGAVGHINPIKRGTLRVQLHFAKPLPHPVTVLAFCEFDNIIEIDQDRNVYLNNGFVGNKE